MNDRRVHDQFQSQEKIHSLTISNTVNLFHLYIPTCWRFMSGMPDNTIKSNAFYLHCIHVHRSSPDSGHILLGPKVLRQWHIFGHFPAIQYIGTMGLKWRNECNQYRRFSSFHFKVDNSHSGIIAMSTPCPCLFRGSNVIAMKVMAHGLHWIWFVWFELIWIRFWIQELFKEFFNIARQGNNVL